MKENNSRKKWYKTHLSKVERAGLSNREKSRLRIRTFSKRK